jgi:tetratricopeptide (TPR) repeat protein
MSSPVPIIENTALRPAISPRLRQLLVVLSMMVVLLVANSAYLSGVRLMQWLKSVPLENYFYQWMVLGHLALGVVIIMPFLVFAILHILAARHHSNRKVVKLGYVLFGTGGLLLISGVLLSGVGALELRQPFARGLVYWLHAGLPLVVAWIYFLHRAAGPRIHLRSAMGYGGFTTASLLIMVGLHSSNPTTSQNIAQPEGVSQFGPSLARTATGKLIPAESLMMDSYCIKCHSDVHDGWLHSAHHFSSFNNPMYLASVRETRAVSLKRDENVSASRWCAGCHDPVPLFSGAFDDPNFDDVKHPTAHAGITCTTCHMITKINSTLGNADYTIDEPIHYPFTGSSNRILQYINEQLVKAKPSFHKRMFLKPLHKTTEFCATCHKVHIPRELTHYRDFLRGQNHFDSFKLSGVSGHGARSSYYPMHASKNCNGCHMPFAESADFGARPMPGSGKLAIHDHRFLGANTALPYLHGNEAAVKRHQEFLGKALRIDIIALRDGGTIDAPVTVPLRENIWLKKPHREEHKEAFELEKRAASLPRLKPGNRYLLDIVIRNLKTGHHFTQGTVDSNQVWLDVVVRSGGRIIGRSGGMDDENRVDPWSHFVNAYVIDRDGRRIDRRNPQDIFTVLYNHQIGPGSAQVAHYELQVPDDLTDLITVEATLRYRKFDSRFMDFVTSTAKPGDQPIRGFVPGQPWKNELPITTMASDQIVFPVEGVDREAPFQEYPITIDHVYQRWHDYGIALMNEGAGTVPTENTGIELRLAEKMFLHVDRRFGYLDGPLHLAKLYLMEGRIDDAVAAMDRAREAAKPLFFHIEPIYPPWGIAWLSGLIKKQQGDLDGAIRNFRTVLDFQNDAMREHGYDISRDYIVINELGQTLVERAKLEPGPERKAVREGFLRQAAREFEKTLSMDQENAMAYYNLSLIYGLLAEDEKAAEHRALHARYKPDDIAPDRARQAARLKDPAANHAAERIVIYSLNRLGAPGLTERQPAARTSKSKPKTGVNR